MNVQDITDRVRKKLQDECLDDPLFPDPDLIEKVGSWQREMRRRRPDLFLKTDSTMSAMTTPAELTDTLLLGEDWLMAGVYWVVSELLSEEDVETVNLNASQMYRQKFAAEIA